MKNGIELYCGDCLDVMRKIPDASIDCVLTDPPYGLKIDGQKRVYVRTLNTTGKNMHSRGGTHQDPKKRILTKSNVSQKIILFLAETILQTFSLPQEGGRYGIKAKKD